MGAFFIFVLLRMILEQRIKAFVILGKLFEDIAINPHNHDDFYEIADKAKFQNPWFTKSTVASAVLELSKMLEENSLKEWTLQYNIQKKAAKRIAVVMAGNIPLVGFHDALCVLITGNFLIAKLSSKDSILMEYVLEKLAEIEPAFSKMYEVTKDKLKNFDAIISTGSDNSARYFEYYFGKYPHIIRKNRNSVAVILDSDTPTEYQKIGEDIFSYFGLGCRNVSKIYVPQNFNMVAFLDSLTHFESLTEHHKYMNNYEYNRSIFLMSQIQHLDTGYALFKEENSYNSPIAVVNYSTYNSLKDVELELQQNAENLQCVVCSENTLNFPTVLPGESQQPKVSDYADNIDTIKFLIEL